MSAPTPEKKRRQAGWRAVHAGCPDGPARVSKGSGGRSHPDPPPQIVNRRVQVLSTNHPSTDRWVTLTTTGTTAGTYAYRVAVVDGFNRHIQTPVTYPTLDDARKHANQLYNAMTEEDDQ
ncbi:hypothetical protein QI633_09585 [Nocardioides sp. QY071]|uniref:hypothetical protein n=1 Tax=Nocardioides sp. QY071 TaxID=3044187 RepID=UPI00249B38AB|nr:hypothetical protein [Nocardioides sp. QY071]WGY04004.1 hypothetical protein QI633_09585 [Nocardioides sp. QY071]